jgi:hypothetical protein
VIHPASSQHTQQPVNHGRMRAHTAGKARGRYTCPVTGSLVTLGQTGVQAGLARRRRGKGVRPRLRRQRTPGPAGESPFTPRVALVPAGLAGNPDSWVVNDKLTYRKCAACPAKVVASDATRMPGPWTPRRAAYRKHGRNNPVSPGPHPAASYACRDCDPRRTDPEPN